MVVYFSSSVGPVYLPSYADVYSGCHLNAKKRIKTPSPAKRAAGARSLRAVAEKVPRPPELEGVFTPVEIDFFERAADMYGDEYDVWADFRPDDVN